MTENKGLQALEGGVLRRDLCTMCGACASLCPYLRSWQGRIVKLHDCDLSEGRCYAYCPRTDVDLEALHRNRFGQEEIPLEMGSYREVFMARATDPDLRRRAQTGGVVSALADLAMREDVIDTVILTRRDEQHLPQGWKVCQREQIVDCAGSSYVAGATLEALNRGPWRSGERIGVVGVPCQVLALAKMRASSLEESAPIRQIRLVIGLFCTWALTYQPFMDFLRRQIDGSSIRKLDITPPPERLLKVTTDDGVRDIPLDEIRPFIRPTCGVCPDMTAEFSDLSVGTVEGHEGWNTVMVRTEAGVELLRRAVQAGVVEKKVLPLEKLAHLVDASILKKRRALTALKDRGELETGYLRIPPQWIRRILLESGEVGS
jgi:coenzyme F420 hydrogenase subunit beta